MIPSSATIELVVQIIWLAFLVGLGAAVHFEKKRRREARLRKQQEQQSGQQQEQTCGAIDQEASLNNKHGP